MFNGILLKGKTAIVTGSTSGIGQGIAYALAAQGCNILVNGMGDQAQIDAEVKNIASKYSVKTAFSGDDLSKADGVVNMVKTAEKEFGQVDILINNAGIQFTSLIEDFPVEKWDAIIAINLSAAFHATKAVIAGMKKRGWGRIINIASVHGLVASENKSAYVAAKHGIVGLTKTTALEAATSGVTCNAICPGWVLTPLVQKQINDRAKKEGIEPAKAKTEMVQEKQPTQQFVTVEELGALAVYLSGDMAKAITGTTIAMDGGWTAQ